MDSSDGDAASWAQSAADNARRENAKLAKRVAKLEALLGVEPEPEPPPAPSGYDALADTLKRIYAKEFDL